MIPYSYNMVDMGGIDLAEANGTEVPGVYEKIVEAMNLCGDLILYNWKFAGINIAPSAYTVLKQTNSILINGLIQVTELDLVTVIGIPPPLVPVSPLVATENGLYEAEPPASGFNPVRVAVAASPLYVTENGTYEAEPPSIGFSPIIVNVASGEYVRVRVYSGDSTLYEEYFVSGSQVSIDEIIFDGSTPHRLSFEGTLNTSLNISVSDLPIIPTNFSIVQSYMVESIELTDDGLEIVPRLGEGAAGVVLSGEVDAIVIYKNYQYRQCGRCTISATLPNIQNTGSGRTYYDTPNNDTQVAIPFVSGQNFFASGISNMTGRKLIIKNFIREE